MLLGNGIDSGLSLDCRADVELSMGTAFDDGPGRILLKIVWPSCPVVRDFRMPVTQGDTQFMSGKPRAATAEPEGKAVFMHTGPPGPSLVFSLFEWKCRYSYSQIMVSASNDQPVR